jgi:trk system potassium uptake protein
MSYRRLALVMVAVVEATGAAMMSAAAIGAIYGEWSDAGRVAVVSASIVLVSDLTRRRMRSPGELSPREGFAAVGLAWSAMVLVGTLPYVVTGAIDGFTNAFFETAAGFTTTGSSVVPDPAQLSHTILWWRALTQWMGGMGIIVLSIAILPLLGVGGVQLARAEYPGGTPDRLTPRFRETAKRLWILYVGFTAAQATLLSFSDMTVFDAIAHSFTTMSTGGFGTRAESMAAFNPYAQWVVVVFMIAAGASFALHFRALRKPVEYLRHAELKLYLAILGCGAAFVVIGRLGSGVLDAIREGVFNAVSIITTTGYANADFGSWAAGLQLAIVGFMFIGGMAGSTAGSLKTFRLGVLTSAARADLRHLVHPKGLFQARLGRSPVETELVHSVQ